MLIRKIYRVPENNAIRGIVAPQFRVGIQWVKTTLEELFMMNVRFAARFDRIYKISYRCIFSSLGSTSTK
jgi:hypothetical protein